MQAPLPAGVRLDADDRGNSSTSTTPINLTPEEPALQARVPAFPTHRIIGKPRIFLYLFSRLFVVSIFWKMFHGQVISVIPFRFVGNGVYSIFPLARFEMREDGSTRDEFGTLFTKKVC